MVIEAVQDIADAAKAMRILIDDEETQRIREDAMLHKLLPRKLEIRPQNWFERKNHRSNDHAEKRTTDYVARPVVAVCNAHAVSENCEGAEENA